MIIEETKGNTEILISKSTRDKIMSARIPVDSGINNTPSCTYIVGKPGSGKTHYVESLMKSQYRNSKSGITTCFDSVFVVSPASSQDSYSNSFIKDCDPEKVYDTLNYNNLADIYEGIKETHDLSDKDNNYFSLLILDDVATELRDKQVSKLLLRLLRNHRHLSLTILIISQNYLALEKNCRDNIQCLVQFATHNILEKDRIRMEYLGHLKRKEFEILWEYLFREKYQFLMVDRKHETIHKTFNRLDITGIEKTL